jgi:hypothetical protein
MNILKIAEFEEQKYCELRKKGFSPVEAVQEARRLTVQAFKPDLIEKDPNQLVMF